jgi:ornithine carbamoyltransferase
MTPDKSARHLLSISDLDDEALAQLVDHSLEIAAGTWEQRRPMMGKNVGIFFRKTSTRTRTSFTLAAQKLGAGVIAYGPNDLQMVTGESAADTGRVLANYLDALVIRTNESVEEMRQFGSQQSMAIVNAMSAEEHPTQAIADLATMKEAFGQLGGLHVLYLGEGNNTATGLALACAKTPHMRLTLATPAGEGLPELTLESIQSLARSHRSVIDQEHALSQLPRGVDVVYTTRWTTMGVPKSDPNWLEKYRPYSVTSVLMARVSNERTVFMHDLPAMRGQEVEDKVLDGSRSIAFRQAFHKLTSAISILSWCTRSL